MYKAFSQILKRQAVGSPLLAAALKGRSNRISQIQKYFTRTFAESTGPRFQKIPDRPSRGGMVSNIFLLIKTRGNKES
jgi:hypothetical protein